MTEIETEDLGSTDLLEVFKRINGKVYAVREADSDAAGKFRGMQMACLKIADGKAAGILPGLSDSQVFLVSRCLYEVTGTIEDLKARRAVPLAVIKLWPDRITNRLFEIAQEISELKEPETIEGLTKQIAELQEKLDKLKADKAAGKEDDPAKNEPLKTADGTE